MAAGADEVGALRLGVFGDSIVAGVGATRAEDALAHRLAAALVREDVDVVTRVFAVPGARSAELAAQVEAAATWAPAVALVVIGANDLTHLVPPERAVAGLVTAVRALRGLGSEVVVAPAPDLGSVPWVPPTLRGAVSAASEVLRRAQVDGALREGAHVADADGATTRAFTEDPSLFSGDRSHPSSAGYAVIATALLPAVLAAVRAANRVSD